MSIKLILIRHGESEDNAQKRISGFSDVNLTEKGIWQAKRLAYRLRNLPVDAVYCSDLKRAIHTADIVFGDRGIELFKKPNLREVNFGDWERKIMEEIKLREKEKFTSWFINPEGKSTPPQGESLAAFNHRIMTGVNTILQNNNHDGKDKTIAIVCHGGAIRIVLCNALKIELKNVWHMKQKSTALNIIEYYESEAFVSLVNDASHLENWWEKN